MTGDIRRKVKGYSRTLAPHRGFASSKERSIGILHRRPKMAPEYRLTTRQKRARMISQQATASIRGQRKEELASKFSTDKIIVGNKF